MGDGRDLVRLLRAADERISRASLSHEAHARIRAELTTAARGRPRDRSRRLLPLAGALCGAAALWLVMRLLGGPAEDPEVTAVRAAGFAWQGARCSAAESAGSLTLDGECRVRAEEQGISISSRGQAEIVRLDDGVQLARGTAEFEVAHRPRRQPVRVRVSAGAIEVTGTRFIVEQSGQGGHVDLLEGSIRFRAKDDTVTQVRPGTRFTWVDPPSPPRPAVPPAGAPPPPIAAGVDAAAAGRVDPAPAPATATATATGSATASAKHAPRASAGARSPASSAARLIERVQVLRAQRRYQEAIDLLRQAQARSWDPDTAEILSFEEGDLLDRAGDPARACDHWRAHAKRFPGGMYREAVSEALSRPRCL
jgi:hypothetical protein